MKILAVLCCSCHIILFAAAASGDEAASFTEMFTKGSAAFDFRYRYEHVDQDSLDRSASANTLRSRVTLSTARWHGIAAVGEVDNVWDFGADNYNSTENGNTHRPVIADPTGTDLNQLYLRYSADEGDATLGRQRINYGSQRFVGGVAWRQNEQTFDGVRGRWRPLAGLQLDASYVAQANRIFGPDDGANPAELEGDNYFFRADYKFIDNHSLAVYAYLLDIDDDPPYDAGKTVNNSSDTFGLEYSGKFGLASVTAAWATQSEAGDSELKYDADYWFAELGLAFEPAGIKIGYEVLGAGDNVGFATPLATLHKFQGWADLFLSTPVDGIEDLYVGADYRFGAFALQATYHDFQAEDSSEDFGSEIDVSLVWKVHKLLTLQLKYADFDTDSDRYADTQKYWLVAQTTF